jgi:hypothetical protein
MNRTDQRVTANKTPATIHSTVPATPPVFAPAAASPTATPNITRYWKKNRLMFALVTLGLFDMKASSVMSSAVRVNLFETVSSSI